MRIVADDKLIRRNSAIGKYATFGGLAILLGALVVNIITLMRPAEQVLSLFYLMVGLIAVGMALSSVGSYFTNRWGRRPDRALAEHLKGLDERYTLYNYRLGAAHVLVGPAGPVILWPKYQAGTVQYDGKRWTNPGGRRGMFGLMNPDPLGNPVADAASEVDAFNRFLKRTKPDLAVAPQAVVVFMHPRAEVHAKNTALPVMHAKQLKEYIRRLPRDPAVRIKDLAALAE